MNSTVLFLSFRYFRRILNPTNLVGAVAALVSVGVAAVWVLGVDEAEDGHHFLGGLLLHIVQVEVEVVDPAQRLSVGH